MKRSEVSKKLGIHKNTLLYYEECGLTKPERGVNGYRVYSKEDVIKLTFAKKMLDGGASLELIKKVLKSYSEWKNNHRIDDCKKTFKSVEFIASTIEEQIKKKTQLASNLRQSIDSFNCNCTDACKFLESDTDKDLNCPLINFIDKENL
jgi:DNA-binding transcriptional MerR regulator